MKYRAGYKFQLAEDWTNDRSLGWLPDCTHDYFEVKGGVMTVRKGYAWDGCSGPTWDNRRTMVPSLFHDVCYQMLRLGMIATGVMDGFRQWADEEFYLMLRDRKFWKSRARLWKWALRKFGPSDGGKIQQVIEVL